MEWNSMRLADTPDETSSATRKAWDVLFNAFGHEAFHPIEGRGALISSLDMTRSEAESMLLRILDRGFAVAGDRESY